MYFLRHELYILLFFPIILYSFEISQKSKKFIRVFQRLFPDLDVNNTKVYDLLKNQSNIIELVKYNTQTCSRRYHKNHKNLARVTRSVYKAFKIPLDRESTPFIPPTRDYNPDHYCYIDPEDYYNFNMTDSELAYSREGWDYSPYVPPGETTTEFVFPSWNYDGKMPEVFYDVYTKGELDPYFTSTIPIPDDELGYTDGPRIHNFSEFCDVLWSTFVQFKHSCDNYTTMFSCLQGPTILPEMALDPTNDPID